MTDSVGGTAIPLVPPEFAPADVVTDPLVSYMLSFLKAVGNAYGQSAWARVNPALAQKDPMPVPVANVCAWDPEVNGIAETQLPALFMWRDGNANHESIGQDVNASTGQCLLEWVPAPREQAQRRTRSPYVNGLLDVFKVCSERGRDPAWYLEGDAYPSVSADPNVNKARCKVYGSVLHHYTGAARCWIRSWKPRVLVIGMDGVTPKRFEAYRAIVTYEEWQQPAIDRYDLLLGVDQKIKVNADSSDPTHLPEYVLVEEIFD